MHAGLLRPKLTHKHKWWLANTTLLVATSKSEGRCFVKRASQEKEVESKKPAWCGVLPAYQALWAGVSGLVRTAILPLVRKFPSFVSTGAQYRAPTSRDGTAMKLGPGPMGA